MLVSEVDSVRALIARLMPRVLRMARGLMGGSPDAREAALHALVELLRAPPEQRPAGGARAIERFAALSILRFSRAVERRNAALSGIREARGRASGGADSARTFEQYLFALSHDSRELLLLRHGLGFTPGDLADVLGTSVARVCERLLVARRELRALVRRGGEHPMGPGARRWCAQRDREAVGECLRPEERRELRELEAQDADVWAYVAQVRALELYFDSSREEPDGADRELLERALLALQVTSSVLGPRSVESEEALELSMEPRGSRAVRIAALGASAALAAATLVALMAHRPAPPRTPPTRASAASAPRFGAGPTPPPQSLHQATVEALPVVRELALERPRGRARRSAADASTTLARTSEARGGALPRSAHEDASRSAPDDEPRR